MKGFHLGEKGRVLGCATAADRAALTALLVSISDRQAVRRVGK